ncbi:MAG: hypothetical protein OXU67_11115, partial [Chloroflexota bacterium]|nr:hypothetical protein [Chloroflexota bacterium]
NRHRAELVEAHLDAVASSDMLAGQGTSVAAPMQDALLVGEPEMRRALQCDDGAVREGALRLDRGDTTDEAEGEGEDEET